MSNGYVKLSRKIKESWMIQGDHDALAVFIYLLTNATHKPHKIVVDGKVVELLPGQVLGGRKRLARECGLTEKQIRRILMLFESAEIAAIEGAGGRAKAVSVVTLVNWGVYQVSDGCRAKIRASKEYKQGPKEGQTRATDNKGKNEKNEKNSNRERGARALNIDLPEWINPEVWASFIDHRKAIKAPMTAHAQSLLITKLEKHKTEGFDPTTLLNEAIMNGWKTVYPKTDSGKALKDKVQRSGFEQNDYSEVF